MKNILLLIHDDEGQEARYQAALDVVRAQAGHLTCLDLTIIPEFVGDLSGSAGVLLAEEQGSETANKVRMMARLEREEVSFDWIDRTAFAEQAIEDASRLADLIVLSTDDHGAYLRNMTTLVGDLLLKLGKPILAIPPHARHFDVIGRAMVAWDGSKDAEAALQATTPLLMHARAVTIYQADEHTPCLPAEDAARYLSRHGIHAVVKHEGTGFDRPATSILSEAEVGHHDYVVMGAFGHGRMIETVFGGVTRTMLAKSPLPLLLVHRR